MGGAPALPLPRARLHEAALVLQRLAGLSLRTLRAWRLREETAGARATLKLGAGGPPVVAAADVAVVVPPAAVQSQLPPPHHTGPPRRFLAAGASYSWRTDAAESIDFIHTCGAEGAGRRLALIDVDSAVWTGETRRTFTSIPVVSIHTGPTVVAGMRTAVVGVLAAGGALPAFLADAAERVSVHHAGSSILTGTQHTAAVLRDATGRALPAGSTMTLEGVSFIVAGSSVVTRLLVTLTHS